jgi:hypothetical protein
LKGVIWGVIILVIGHNFLWTLIHLNAGSGYVDVEIIAVDKEDHKRKTITQHADYGVFGDSYRTVTVYELSRVLRIIESEQRN